MKGYEVHLVVFVEADSPEQAKKLAQDMAEDVLRSGNELDVAKVVEV